jgi:hypothetical protein
MTPTLKAPGTKRLKLKHAEQLSSYAFKCNLRRYTKAEKTAAADAAKSEAAAAEKAAKAQAETAKAETAAVEKAAKAQADAAKAETAAIEKAAKSEAEAAKKVGYYWEHSLDVESPPLPRAYV